MKKILFSTIFLVINAVSFAQTTGLNLSYNLGSISPYTSIKTLLPSRPDSLTLSAAPGIRTAYGVGGFARFGYASLKPVFLQAELCALYNKHLYEFRDAAGNLVSSYERTRYRIDAPITLGVMIDFKKIIGLRIHGGLVPSLPMPEVSNSSFDTKWAEVFNNGNIAYTYGVGLDIVNFVQLDVRVQNDFSPRRESTIPEGLTKYDFFRLTQNQIVVKLGFRLSKEKE